MNKKINWIVTENLSKFVDYMWAKSMHTGAFMTQISSHIFEMNDEHFIYVFSAEEITPSFDGKVYGYFVGNYGKRDDIPEIQDKIEAIREHSKLIDELYIVQAKRMMTSLNPAPIGHIVVEKMITGEEIQIVKHGNNNDDWLVTVNGVPLKWK